MLAWKRAKLCFECPSSVAANCSLHAKMRMGREMEGTDKNNLHLSRVMDNNFFLPAAKPSGPRTVRVVGVMGGRDWDPTQKS